MPTYLIDFDSTFTKVEALDLLAGIALNGQPDRTSTENKIASITDLAMNGHLSFDIALKQRIELLPIHQSHLLLLINELKKKVSDSFVRNQSFLRSHADSIFIISGGFKDFIVPVIEEFGLKPEHVFANTFLFNEAGWVSGYDTNNMLSKSKGKVTLVESLHLRGEIVVIGDGYTDYEIKAAGLASSFMLFTENVQRIELFDKADRVVKSLDEIISN